MVDRGDWTVAEFRRREGCPTRVCITDGNGVSNVADLCLAEIELPNGIKIQVPR